MSSVVDLRALVSWLEPYLSSYGRTWGESHALHGYVLVASHGAPIFERAYGFADRAARIPPTADTRFRIASVTKQMTAVAVLQLFERGLLDLDDPFRRFVPEYPAATGDGVTVRHLLAHRSGLPDYAALPYPGSGWGAVPRTNDEVLALVRDRAVHFAPGTDNRYSNTNYYLLAMIVERLSGLSFDAYLRAHAFGPAGMSRSSASEGDFDDEATGYTPGADDALVPAEPYDLGIPFGAGGVRSTARDLLRWQRALHDETTLLSRESHTAMLTSGFGIGRATFDGLTFNCHHGGMPGFTSTMWRAEDLAVDIIALLNTQAIMAGNVGSDIVEMICRRTPVAPRVERPCLPLDRATIEAVAGDYVATAKGRATLDKAFTAEMAEATSKLELRVEGGALLFDVHMGPPLPLFLGEDGALFTKSNGIVLTLERDDAGRARGVTVTQHGKFVVEYER